MLFVAAAYAIGKVPQGTVVAVVSGELEVRVIPQYDPESVVIPAIVRDSISSTVAEIKTPSIGATETSELSSVASAPSLDLMFIW